MQSDAADSRDSPINLGNRSQLSLAGVLARARTSGMPPRPGKRSPKSNWISYAKTDQSAYWQYQHDLPRKLFEMVPSET